MKPEMASDKNATSNDPTCIDSRDAYAVDMDVGESEDLQQATDDLQRRLKPRQLNMLAIAGAIGTGLIIGSGSALARGGPGGLLFAYVFVGAMVYFIMTALAEMATYCPTKKGFAGYATKFVDPALGFATGWNYFFKYVIVLPNNLTAAGIIIQYWRPDLNVAIWVTVFGFCIIVLNVFHVRYFGEAEFWLSIVKIAVLTMLILVCLVITLGGGPTHDRVGFRHWRDPGAFVEYRVHASTGRFLGVWAAIVQACFAYTGTEVVGVAFGETPNPRKNVPQAINQTLFRIGFFYVLGALLLGMCIPCNSALLIGATKAKTSAAASPFVIAIKMAKIRVLPDIINALLLVFVLSAANSDIYVASRTLFGLARDGQAPSIFHKTTASGVPIYGVAAGSAFILLGYMNVAKFSSTVFGYFVSLVTVFGTLNWVSLLVSYIGMRRSLRKQGIPLSDLPYRGPLQPYGAYFALLMTVLIVLFNGYSAFVPTFDLTTFITSYIGVLVYVLNVVVWKLVHRTRRVRGQEIYFTSE